MLFFNICSLALLVFSFNEIKAQVMNYSFNLIADSTKIIEFKPAYYNYLVPKDRVMENINDSLVVLLIIKNKTIEYRWKYPVFPGGMDSLDKYIYTNLKYPKDAIDKNIEKVVDVFFRIDKNGQVQKINVEDPTGYFDKEAIRLIRNIPSWKPGYENGKQEGFSLHWKIKFALINGKPMTYEIFKQQQTIEKALTVYYLGAEKLNMNEIPQAIVFYTKAIEINPLDFDAYYDRGTCKGKLADKEGACKDWNKALELGGRDHLHFAARFCK